jgi:5-methylcytosine-specific restriction enzyme A
LKLEVNSEVIFDSSESQFDILRRYLKFNRSSKSRAALARIVYEATIQVLTKQFEPGEFQKLFLEGQTKLVSRNIYERNPKAREICIEFYGSTCLVCSLNFNDTYGEIGNGFIHVHHLVPISSIKEEYHLDPIRDLRPVCPNCHAMIHKRIPPFTINELKDILNRS